MASTSGTSPRKDASARFRFWEGRGRESFLGPSPCLLRQLPRPTRPSPPTRSPQAGEGKTRRRISNMPEPASQIVAQMPRGKRAGLLLLFLGPAVALYPLFLIYPLIAPLGVSTYTSGTACTRPFFFVATFEVLICFTLWS